MLVKDNYVSREKKKESEERSGNVFLEQKDKIRGDFASKHPGVPDPMKQEQPKVVAPEPSEPTQKPTFTDDDLSEDFKALLRQNRENEMRLLTPQAVTQFAVDAEDYRKRSVEQFQGMSWQQATDPRYQSARRQESAYIAKRASLVSDWLDANREQLTQEGYDFYKAYLNDFAKSQKEVDSAYQQRWDAAGQFETQEAYDKAIADLPLLQKYGDMTYSELRAIAQKMPESPEKRWLDEFSQNHKTKDYYEAEKRRKQSELEYLEKSRADYIRLMHVPQMAPNEPGYQALKAEYDVRMPELENLNIDYLIEEKKKEIYHLDKSILYGFLYENKDFEANCGYKGGGTRLQQMVNNPEAANDWDNLTTAAKAAGIPGARLQEAWNYENVHLMEDEERKIFNYLYNTQGEDAAEDYMDWLQYQLNERSKKKLTDWVAAKTGNNAAAEVLGSVLSTPIALLSGEGILDAAAQKIIRDFSGEYKPIDYNRDGMFASIASGTIRNTVAKDIAQNAGAGWAAAYNVGMGLQDSVAIAAAAKVNPALGKVAATLLSGAAATDTMLNAVERGATDDQAIGLGILSGAFEMFFEKYELDSLMGQSDDVIRATCKQALSEGVGESATDLSNMVADYVIMGKNSNWSANVQGYIDQGLSPEEAKKKAFWDSALQVGMAAGGGMISGGIMGGGQAVIQNASTKSGIKSATAEAYGGTYADAYRDDLPGLVASALKLDAQNATALQVQKKLQAGEEISNGEILQLAKPVRIAEAAGRRLQELGVDQDVEAVSNAIGKELSGQGLTSDEKALLKNHPQAQQVMDELRSEGRDERAYVKSLQQKAIDTYRKQRTEYARAQKKVDKAKYTEDAVASLMEGIEPVRKAPTARDQSAGAISDLVDETVAQLTGAPSDPLKAAVEGFRTSGTVSNKQATDILNNAGAVEQLVQETGMVLPATASGKRAAVKEAVAKLGSREMVVDSGAEEGTVDAAPVMEASTAENGSLAAVEGSASQAAAVVKDNTDHRRGDPPIKDTAENVADGRGDAESVGAAPEGFDTYSHLQFEYGNKPDRAGTVRDINVPNRDAAGNRVSDFAANLYGNVITEDEMVDTLENLIAQGAFGAQTMKLDDVLNNSINRVERKYTTASGTSNIAGFTRSLSETIAEGRYSPELLADAMVMMTKAQSEGDFVSAGEIAFLAADIARVGGRILNVAKLTKRLSPEGQLQARRSAAQKVSDEVNKKRKSHKQVDVAITEATEQEFINVSTAGETIITDAANALNAALNTDAEAAADAAIANLNKSETKKRSGRKKKGSETPETTSDSDTEIGEDISEQEIIGQKAGSAIAESAKRSFGDSDQNIPREKQLYDAIMEFAKSKTKKLGRRKKNDALDALKEFYSNREAFAETWSAARRRAEVDLADDPAAYDALRQFFDTGGYAQDVMDTYDSDSVSRKALREAAKEAGVGLSRLVSSSLNDKAAALQAIQDYVAQEYELEEEAAVQMAKQLQGAFFRELSQRQTTRLRNLFGEKNVRQSKDAMDLFAELYNTGAFESALISREALKKVFGHDGLSLSQELLDEYGKVSDTRKAAVDRKIIHEIAGQLPTDMWHILGKWRYTAMLANPSTHLKNMVGNTGQFVIQYGLKDNLAAIIEAGVSKVSGGKIQRTKAILNYASKADRALIRDAYQDYGTVLRNDGEIAKRIKNGGKYDSVRSDVEEVRRSFKINNPSNKVTKGIDKGLKGLEYAADFNTKALDAEDAFFGRNAYALSLASYMKANNLTVITEEARTYAIAQAQECTFHDDSLIYQAVKKRFGNATKLVVPFVKTPANVTARAVEYSPGMFIKSMVDFVRIGTQSKKTDIELNGKRMTAAKAIDELSKGMIGSALWGIGAWLAAEGLIRVVGTGSEEEREYQRRMGYRDYSLCIGDMCIDISALSPAILPVFTGAAVYETFSNYAEDEVSFQTVLDSIYSFTDPILSSSMLSGLDSFMYAIRSSHGGSTGEFVGTVGREIVETYVSQFFPSFIRRIAAGSDNTMRQTYADPDNPLSAFGQSMQSGIPGARDGVKAKYDVWGREVKQDASGGDGFWGSLWRTVNPFRVADVHTTDIDDEILRLSSAGYDATPVESNQKTIKIDGEEYRLSAEEYGAYEQSEGQLSFDIAQKIIQSEEYQALPDELKAKALNDAYAYSAEYCKADAVAQYQPSVEPYLTGMGKDAGKLSQTIINHTVTSSLNKAMTAVANGGKDAVKAAEDAYATYAALPQLTRMAVDQELGGRSEAFVTAQKAGVSAEAFGYLYGEYQKIDQSDLSASGKAQKWAYTLDGAQKQGRITAAQKKVLKDGLKFYMTMAADSEKYDRMTAAGVSSQTADYVWDLLSGIEPEAGKDNVRDIQRMEAIVEDDRISDEDMKLLLPVYLSEEQQEDFETAMMGQGYSPEDYVEAYRVVLDRQKGDKKNVVIRRMASEAGITYPAAKALYELFT